MTAPRIEIGRLALRAPWLRAEQGEELAGRVADRLAGAELSSGSAAERIAVSLGGRTGESIDELGDRIVAAVMQELRVS